MKLALQIAGGILIATTAIYGAMFAMWEPMLKWFTKSTMDVTKEMMANLEDED